MKTFTSVGALLCGLASLAVSFDAAAQLAPRGEVPTQAPPTPPVAPTSPTQRPEGYGLFLERGQKVTDRPRPELDPLGVRLGTFFFYPRVELDEIYNDNIRATGSNRQDDFITVVSPTLDLRSNWANHALNFRAGASVGTYASHSTENYGDYFASVDGRYDVTRNLYGFGNFRFEHLHEERDSPDTPGTALNPVEFDAYTFNTGIASRGLRIGYQIDFGWLREYYADAQAIGGGTIDQDQRDVDIYTTSARVSYEFAPRYEAFARFGFNRRQYDNSTQGGVFPDRNSQGYRADIGATIDLTGVTFAEVFVGYLAQEYDNADFGTVDAIDAGARVVWNPTELTSVTFLADRRFQDSNSIAGSVFSPGYLRSNVGMTVDHELLRNVLLSGRVNYQNDDYEKIDRVDDRIDIGAGIRYQLNRNFYLGGSYTYTYRSSDGADAGLDFSRNLFLIRFGAQL